MRFFKAEPKANPELTGDDEEAVTAHIARFGRPEDSMRFFKVTLDADGKYTVGG